MTSPSVFTEIVAQADHPAQATAGTAEAFVVGRAPFDGTLVTSSLIPQAAVVADATNNRTFQLQNRGQAGTGTTVMATLVTDVAGGNWIAYDEKFMALSGTPANLQFAQGDVFAIVETTGGTGVAHPQFMVELRGTHR
jgi:hypothetical protein